MSIDRLKNSTVLVTGATGFVGGALCARLDALGVEVKALARRKGRDKYIQGLSHVDVIMGDITDSQRMQEVMQGVDIVIHVAAALGGDMDLQRRVNVEGTANVIKACRDAHIKRLIHISTVAVYGYDLEGEITEAHPLSPSMEAYSLSKAEGERLFTEIDSETLPYVIIRPGGIYGARSGMWLYAMFNIAKRRPTFFIGDGRGYVPLVYIDDLCDLIIEACHRDEAVGEAFNAVYDEPYTWRTYLQAYSKLAGHQGWLAIPIWLVRPLIWVGARFGKPYSQMKVASQAINFLNQPIRFRSQKAKTLLGWECKTSLEDGVAHCEADLRTRGLIK